MKILFNLASRSRPEKLFKCLDNIFENLAYPKDCEVLLKLDSDDTSITPQIGIRLTNYNVTIAWGTSNNKIHAINRDIIIKYWDVMIATSDDMMFIKKGFDETIRANMAEGMCLHFPDGNRKDLITLPIIHRSYYNRFNYVYHPDYKSLWCDNEMTEVAQRLGFYKYVDSQIFEHQHPAYGKSPMDEQYIKTEAQGIEDNETFKRRKYELNFDIK